MSAVCYICNTEADLIRVPGRREMYVCQEHLDQYMTSKQDFATSENDICHDCLMNQVSFIYIAEVPFKKYCSSCASTLKTNTPGCEKVFISINWKKIVKSKESLANYEKIKARIKAIKKQCFKFVKNFEEEIESLELERYNAEVFQNIDAFFEDQVKVLQDYQEEYTKGYKSVLKELKAHIIARNEYGDCKAIRYLGSEEELTALRCLKIAEIDQRLDFNDEFFYAIKLKQPSEFIFNENVVVFFEEKAEVFEYALVKQELIKYPGPDFKLWKTNACWCTFENGEVLYTGGLYNKKESGSCFVVNPRKEMNICVKNCVPRQGHALLVYEDNAYMFGGETLVCEKFVHRENEWQRLADSPKVLKQASAILYNREIFLTGFGADQIFVYNLKTNCFLEADIKVASQQKLLLRFTKKVYLLVDTNVFLFNPDSLCFEKVRGDNLNKNTSVMEPRIADDKVYWVNTEGDLCYFSEKDEKTLIEKTKKDFLKA